MAPLQALPVLGPSSSHSTKPSTGSTITSTTQSTFLPVSAPLCTMLTIAQTSAISTSRPHRPRYSTLYPPSGQRWSYPTSGSALSTRLHVLHDSHDEPHQPDDHQQRRQRRDQLRHAGSPAHGVGHDHSQRQRQRGQPQPPAQLRRCQRRCNGSNRLAAEG